VKRRDAMVAWPRGWAQAFAARSWDHRHWRQRLGLAVLASVLASTHPAGGANPPSEPATANASGGRPEPTRPAAGARDCRPHRRGDPTIYLTDFRWGLTPAQFRKFGRDLYDSEKRLAHRFFAAHDGRIMSPVDPRGGSSRITVPPAFVESVRRHLGAAFRLHIVDHLAMSDLGHAHIYLRGTRPDGLAVKISDPPAARDLLARDIRLLYHSAERLEMKRRNVLSNDPYAQLRFLTRNFVGAPDGRIRIVYQIDDRLVVNSVSRIDHLTPTGRVLYINANHRGCFVLAWDGRIVRFDLSFAAPTGEPGFEYED
jgi:hypothetical protein